jgi:hypothetical protein
LPRRRSGTRLAHIAANFIENSLALLSPNISNLGRGLHAPRQVAVYNPSEISSRQWLQRRTSENRSIRVRQLRASTVAAGDWFLYRSHALRAGRVNERRK